MSVPKSLHRSQLERLRDLLSNDPALTGTFYQEIFLAPKVNPVKNPGNLPTVSIYMSHESISVASTTSSDQPARFIMMIAMDETGIEPTAATSMYLDLIDMNALYLKVLWKNRRDRPNDGSDPLWHAIRFAGDRHGNTDGDMPTGDYASAYARDPGKSQLVITEFFPVANIDNYEN